MDRAFRRAVLERLRMLDGMAKQAEAELPISLARAELRRITAGWRALLVEHQPDAAGRCPVCSGWLRRRKWPCEVWITAHQQLIGEGSGEPPARSAPAAPTGRPPRNVEVVRRRTDAEDTAQIPNPRDSRSRQVPAQIHRAAVIERHPTMPLPRLGGRRDR